jgi:hypothetical protein
MELVVSNAVIKEWSAAWSAHARWRSVAVAVAATSMLLVGCGSEDSAPATASPEDGASTSATSEVPATSEGPAVSPLEGSWQAGPISLEETEATVRRHGLGRWVTDYRANAPFFGDTVLTLTIEDGEWDLYGKSGGGQPVPIDYDADYEIDGDTVVFHHSDGSNTYRWAIDGDTLRLQFDRTTFPVVKGEIPEEAYQRALYMTAPFTRQN